MNDDWAKEVHEVREWRNQLVHDLDEPEERRGGSTGFPHMAFTISCPACQTDYPASEAQIGQAPGVSRAAVNFAMPPCSHRRLISQRV